MLSSSFCFATITNRTNKNAHKICCVHSTDDIAHFFRCVSRVLNTRCLATETWPCMNNDIHTHTTWCPFKELCGGHFRTLLLMADRRHGRSTTVVRCVPVAYLQTVRKKEIMTRLTRLTLSSFVFCSLFFFSSLFFLVLSFWCPFGPPRWLLSSPYHIIIINQALLPPQLTTSSSASFFL